MSEETSTRDRSIDLVYASSPTRAEALALTLLSGLLRVLVGLMVAWTLTMGLLSAVALLPLWGPLAVVVLRLQRKHSGSKSILVEQHTGFRSGRKEKT